MIATVPFRARFLQTPPHGDAFALRYPFAIILLD